MRDFDNHAVKMTPETSPWLRVYLCLFKMDILHAFAAAIITHCRQKHLKPVEESIISLKELYLQVESVNDLICQMSSEFISGKDISSDFPTIDDALDVYFRELRDFVILGKVFCLF